MVGMRSGCGSRKGECSVRWKETAYVGGEMGVVGGGGLGEGLSEEA